MLAACTVSDLNAQQVVMNNAVRFILDVSKRAHITPHLKKLHFLPVKQRILYKLCLLAYKIMNNTAPQYLLDIFHCFQPTTTMPLRQTTETERDIHLMTYMNNIELTNKCVFQRLISSWNSLPLSLRITDSLDSFKRELKIFYLNTRYYILLRINYITVESLTNFLQ